MLGLVGTVRARIRNRFRRKSSKRIFAFHDGSQWRTVDPIEVLHKIDSHPSYLPSKHDAAVKSGDREAIAITADAACDVFGVKPYRDGTGLTIGERIALLSAFADYCYWVKKNINPGAISAPSTEQT